MMLIMMIGFSHIVGDSDALLDVDGDAFLFVDVLANLVEMILIMTNGVSDDYVDDQDVVDDDSNGDVDVLANLVGMMTNGDDYTDHDNASDRKMTNLLLHSSGHISTLLNRKIL